MTRDALRALGWGPRFAERAGEGAPLRIVRVHRSGLDAAGEEGTETLPPDAEVTVGDWLVREADGTVSGPLERTSLIRRRAPGTDREVQLIAANVDTVLVATSCNADFNPARLERYLAIVFEAGCSPVVLLTKPDEADDPDAYLREAETLAPGTPVLMLDARAPEAREALAPWTGPGRTLAVLGMSGVGKSTLLNTLMGAEAAATGAARGDDARGRHTTTRRELHLLPGGACLIDTPGMRELKLSEAADGIDEVFADIAALSEGCRFRDCLHESEPGCSVRGEVDPDRLARWRKLATEDARNTADLAERRRKDRAFGKKVRAAVKAKRR